ncbi:DUF1302 domain-containing protein [Pseudomonas sp. NPDC096950]|uniref:DUF1302 domain-containing protein n=1 Tax=Pseudomonas sp. NPDC096950 TaxID=3364485 RepID=UPI00383B6096
MRRSVCVVRNTALGVSAWCGVVSTVLPFSMAQAMQIQTDSDWQVRWDNTLKYSLAYRVGKQDSKLTDSPTLGGLYPNVQSQGDRNFDRGLVSNRVDVFSELDVSQKNYGLRVSGATWYDDVYNQDTDSSDQRHFLDDTRQLHGRDAELLDAFVFVRGNVGDKGQATVRLGRHSLIYGESLFFGGNGIANAQGPIDVVKLLSVPGTQFKEILRPVNQVSTQFQVNPQLSLGAYYQFEWERSNIPGAGSYLSTFDILGHGAGTVDSLTGPSVNGGDIKARNSGQGGLQLRYKPDGTDYEFGLYAAQYNDKTPSSVYANLTGVVTTPQGVAPVFGSYNQVYAEKIKTVGASASTSYGPFNFAAEASLRWDAPLVSSLQVVTPGQQADNDSHALYAKGHTAHINLSTIYLLNQTAFWDGGNLLAELAWNRTLSATENRAEIDPNTTRDATAFRVLMEPAYFQVLDGIDITVPIGLGIGLDGRSSAVNQAGFGVEHGGDWSVGVKATYLQDLEFGVNYVNYFGPKAPLLDEAGTFTYGQSLADRDFVSAYVKKTF